MIGQSVSHYRILSRLGAGGMGEVYLAEDTRLDRKVAIKVLPAGSSDDQPAKMRLLREAKAAAALDHPNICSVHEVGQEGDRSFIVMQYVEGETLAQRLKHKPLDLLQVLSIASQVADALREAHTHRIVHRDIKPANIMLTARGQVKVLDFGLAKIIRDKPMAGSESATVSLTDTGTAIGTLPYMSPEQTRGEKLDGRSDIFSFGAMLYEMISGRQPFEGKSVAEVAAAILTRDVTPLERLMSGVPVELGRLVQKCLEKDREQRIQTMSEVATSLESLRRATDSANETSVTLKFGNQVPPRRSGWQRLITSRLGIAAIAVVIVAAALLAGYRLLLVRSGASLKHNIRSIAMLPLENLSGDASQEYFADGTTEAIINTLTRIRALSRVISRTSVMRYKGNRTKTLPEIASELNVDAIIEGTVQRSGGRVHVTARLIPAEADSPVWSREYDRDETDVLKLQSEIARAVAAEIRIQITPEEGVRLAAARNINPQAHEAYLLGRYHFNKNNEQDWKQAEGYFYRATQIAPDYAAAYAGLSDVWLQRGVFGIKTFQEVEPLAREFALMALHLDEQLAEAHTSLANLKFYNDWDWAGSEAAFKRALELDPGGLDVHRSYGHLLMCLGRHDEAVREGQIAAQLDPLTSETQTSLGRFLYRARRYEEALPHLQLAVEREPRSIGANFRLGDVFVELGRYTEALAVYEKGRELTGDDGTFQAAVARLYALMGKTTEARQMIRGRKEQTDLIARVYAALGDKNEAFRILTHAIANRNVLVVTLKEDPPFDSLHSDPRWKELLIRINFPSP